jgi:hypothetical protein
MVAGLPLPAPAEQTYCAEAEGINGRALRVHKMDAILL